MLAQFRAISLEKRTSSEKRQVHRRPVMAKAGQGVFAGFHRTPGHRRLFENPDAPALCRQVQRRRQGVVACPDQDRVELPGHASPAKVTQGYLQMHLNLSSMIP